jgi:hypothetical protein
MITFIPTYMTNKAINKQTLVKRTIILSTNWRYTQWVPNNPTITLKII